MPAATAPLLDVLIIGGGPAGLAAATGLARQLYTAVVFDSGVYRNQLATHMHNVVTWDHARPADFRQKAREDIRKRYSTIDFQDNTKIESVKKNQEGRFEATDEAGTVWTGRKLLLATGIKDIYPDIDGYGDAWVSIASSAMDGAEELGEQIALGLKGSVSGIKVDKRRIRRLAKGPERSEVDMVFEDGSQIREGFLVHKPKSEINGPFAHQLSLELTEQGDIKTTQPFHESSMPGVFAVGDCATFMKAVSMALSMGSLGAGGLATQLQMEPF